MLFYLKGKPDVLYFDQDGGTASVKVSANTGWKANIPESWCTASRSSSDYSLVPVEVVFTVEKNNSITARKQQITLTSTLSGSIKTTITINQEAGTPDDPEDPDEPLPADSLWLNPEGLDIWCKGGAYDVILYANTEWSYEGSSHSWCVLQSGEVSGGSGSYVLTIAADTTKQGFERTAVLTFLTAQDSVFTFPVTQRPVGISLPEELVAFRDDVNAGEDLESWMDADSTIHLRADLDMSLVSNWTPIGMHPTSGNRVSLKGIFDGNGYTVSNLKITQTDLLSAGLFGYVRNAEIRNLTLDESCSITLSASGNRELSVGGIAGRLEGSTVTDCHFHGTILVTGTGTRTAAGGIAGSNTYKSVVAYCSNSGVVEGLSSVGGIVGVLEESLSKGNLIKNSENRAGSRVLGTASVGGICGMMNSYNSIEWCTNRGFVQATNENAGGICGEMYGSSSVLYCTNQEEADVKSKAKTGGICGYAMSKCSITGCDNKGTVTGDTGTGGICGTQYISCSIKNCTNTGEVAPGTAGEEAGEGIGGIAGTSLHSEIRNSENKGAVTGASSVGGIAGYFSSDVTLCDLEDCINRGLVEGKTDAGGIAGMVDGSRSALSYLNNYGQVTVVSTDGMAGGIAGKVYGSVTLDNCNNKEEATVQAPEGSAGGIAGEIGSTSVQLSNCENYAAVTAAKWGAGIAVLSEGKISKSTNMGSVSVSTSSTVAMAGGIASKAYRTIESCENEGVITGYNAAGIVTYFAAKSTAYKITKCTNNGEVWGANTAGGLVANIDKTGSIENGSNTAAVTGSNYVAGIVAENMGGTLTSCTNSGHIGGTETELNANRFAMGGICAYNYGGNLTDCENEGQVTRLSETGTYKYVGGVVGVTFAGISYGSGALKNCTNSGAVTGLFNVSDFCFTGGFCGFFASGPTPDNCTNTGTVNGNAASDENEYGGHS
jgi:hypothetical protein